jgi:putative FmdB family regulatory protein
MPLYTFHCSECNSKFDDIVKLGKDIAVCPVCAHPALRDTKPQPTANMNGAWARQCRGK